MIGKESLFYERRMNTEPAAPDYKKSDAAGSVNYVKVILPYGLRYMERDAIIARLVNVYLVCGGCDSQVLQCGIV